MAPPMTTINNPVRLKFMTRADKRWQLLLVADNGRIIPFRHIKGIALTLIIALVLLALACAVLGWRLTAERLRYQKTVAKLSATQDEAARYKRKLELLSADLVLNEARMAKAGLPVPDREPPPKAGVGEPGDATAGAAAGDTATGPEDVATAEPADTKVTGPALPDASRPETAELATPATPAGEAPVAVENPEIRYDNRRRLLIARFRIENTGETAATVDGRCVVVLHKKADDADAWFSMPQVNLVDGKPDGQSGHPFKISRFMNIEIMRAAPADPSVYRTAMIHVFDGNGAQILKKTLDLDLPAPQHDGAAVKAAPASHRIAVENFRLSADRNRRRLTASLRIKNAAVGSGPVAGRCVVVLKSDRVDPGQWAAIPAVPLDAGLPDGTRGRTFRISRFIDLTLRGTGPADPSVFDTAMVFVFDSSGNRMLEKSFPVDLPAPPAVSPPDREAPAAAGENDVIPTPAAVPAANTPAEDAATEKSAADPSPEDGAGTVKREDPRARF